MDVNALNELKSVNAKLVKNKIDSIDTKEGFDLSSIFDKKALEIKLSFIEKPASAVKTVSSFRLNLFNKEGPQKGSNSKEKDPPK